MIQKRTIPVLSREQETEQATKVRDVSNSEQYGAVLPWQHKSRQKRV
jgi:hypothetical protein